MKEKINYNLLIQKYLANELNAIERSEFERLLKQDKQLLTELKLQLAVDKAISDPRLENLKFYLEALYKKNLGGQRNNNSLGYNPYIKLVATVLIIISLGSIFFYNDINPKNTLQYFDEYYEPYDLTFVSRSHSKDSVMSLDAIKLIQSYHNKNYIKAGEILAAYDMDACPDQQLIMMTGIIHLELNNFKLAITEFNMVINDSNALTKQDAIWYLGLTYLKAEELKKAKKILKKIIKEKSFYSGRASELLAKLK